MKFDSLLVDVDGGIATVTINRPDKLNALNTQVIDDLERFFEHARKADDIRGVLLTGAGEKAFVAGADISQFPGLSPAEAEDFARRGQSVFDKIEGLGKPVVAAVNGFALGGGCELALACHVRVASSNASFGQPEVNLGVIPGFGGTQRLPRVVGRGIALEMILSGNLVEAERAEAVGLVNAVVPQEELMDTARGMLAKICAKGPVAVRYAIAAVAASDRPLADGLAEEAALFGKVFATKDMKEGVTAFLERRKPSFSGH